MLPQTAPFVSLFLYLACALVPVRAEAQVPDETALIGRLSGPTNDAREAATALGRMGSAKGLAVLLQGDDDYAVSQFGSGMMQAHRPVLPADVEKLMVASFDRLTKTQYGNLLDALIGNSKYQSRELFRLLLAEARRAVDGWKRGEQARGSPERTFTALVKTDLPIGDDVLALVVDVPSHPATVSARCALVGYFVTRPTPSAVPAIAAMLRKSEDEASAQCIASALGAMATPESIAAVVEESKRVSASKPKVAQKMLWALINQLRSLPPDAPIDLAPLRRALPSPAEAADVASGYVDIVRKRKDTTSVPLLVSYASAADVSMSLQHLVLDTLLEVGAWDDWRKVLEDTDRAFAAQRMSGDRYNLTRSMLAPKLDPEGYRMREAAGVQKANEAGKRGDARVLAELVARGDVARIRDFVSGLRSEDRPHLPPDVEALIVSHFNDGEMGRTLQTMVGPEERNLKRSAYHGRQLFELYAEQMHRGTGSDALKKMLTTDTPIEEPLLALLQGPHLYASGCQIAKYLAERHYAPAIPFLKHALEVGRQAETTNAGCPRDALLQFGTPEATAAAALPDHYAADERAGAASTALRKLEAVPLETPVDFAEVRRAVGTPIPKSIVDDYVRFAARRTPPEAVPDLLGFLSTQASGASLYEPALNALLAYDSPEVWTRTRREVDRLNKEGRLGRWSYDSAVAKLDALTADPKKALASRNRERPHPAGAELAQWDDARLIAELGKVEGQAARDVAKALGQRGTEKGFAALVQRHDSLLLQSFAEGAIQSKMNLTPAIESIIYANLGDERISGSLRYLLVFTSYRDRRIFDRLTEQIVHAREPMDRAVIVSALVKTDLPVEGDVASLLGRLPTGPAEMMTRCPLIRFLGERRYAAAVKPLASELQAATPDMSRCIATALDKIGTGEALRAVMDRVRTLRADPSTSQIAEWIETEAVHTVKEVPSGAPAPFVEAKRAKAAPSPPAPLPLPPRPGEQPWEIVKALENEPAKHVTEVEARLDALASAARPPQSSDRDLLNAYFRLASVLRFTLRDADHAVAVYEKTRRLARPENGGVFSVDLAIADVDQFDRRKPAEAIDHLKKVLEAIAALGAGSQDRRTAQMAAMFDPMTAWLREDIRFLETGKPFTGSVSAGMLGGGIMFMSGVLLEPIAADPRMPPLRDVMGPDSVRPAPMLSHEALAERMRALPPSRGIFFQTLGMLHFLQPDELLAYLAQQDPGRYLSAIILATGALEDYALENGRSGGRPFLLPRPEPGTRYTRSSLRTAAEKFIKETGVRMETPPFVKEQATTPKQVDAVIQATWKRLKAALKKGDIDGALDAVAVSARGKYQPVFQALKDNKSNIDEVMTEIHKVVIRENTAEYEMLRSREGKTLSFFVEFIRDGDGIWRLRTM